MSVLVVGLSHRSTPVELLDRAALTTDDVFKLLTDVGQSEHVAEAAVIATCNRVELYVDVARFHGGFEAATNLLVQHTGMAPDELTPHLYVHYDGRAVQHLFTVAAGLDSMVAGESQVLGQVRSALQDAQAAGTAGRALNTVFQQALRVGKRAHTETGIDSAGRSLVTVGLASLPPNLADLSGRRTLVVGAGSMAALAATTLRADGAYVIVANRTFEHGERLAASVDGEAIALTDLASVLPTVDIVVSCTGSAGTVITRDLVAASLPARGNRPLGLVDLALPHDIEPEAADLPGVARVDFAVIGAATAHDEEAASRTADLAAARAIIADEVAAFAGRQRADQAAPTVIALRAMAEEVVTSELHRLHSRLPDADPLIAQELDSTVRRVVDKLLHAPTVRVKELAIESGGHTYTEALRELFSLDPQSVAAVEAVELPEDQPADGGDR